MANYIFYEFSHIDIFEIGMAHLRAIVVKSMKTLFVENDMPYKIDGKYSGKNVITLL